MRHVKIMNGKSSDFLFHISYLSFAIAITLSHRQEGIVWKDKDSERTLNR